MRTPTALLVSGFLAVGALATACAPGDDGADTTDAAASTTNGASETRNRADEAFQDPEVARIWTRMMDTLAPDDGWPRTRYVQFDWMAERGEGEPLRRSHRWDLWDGQYRVEAPTDEGTMVALFNVNEPAESGRVWIDGELVEEPSRSDSLVSRAHGMFINDSYWLLMPYKWADEGVRAEYLGEMEQWGETYEVVELTFEDVGLTPQNKYRAFVDPESGIMDLWQHYRRADDQEPSFTMRWADWERHGPITLASERPDQEGNSRIRFENLDASTSVPDGAFEPPSGSDAP